MIFIIFYFTGLGILYNLSNFVNSFCNLCVPYHNKTKSAITVIIDVPLKKLCSYSYITSFESNCIVLCIIFISNAYLARKFSVVNFASHNFMSHMRNIFRAIHHDIYSAAIATKRPFSGLTLRHIFNVSIYKDLSFF